jgi:cell division septal protein FtsQ
MKELNEKSRQRGTPRSPRRKGMIAVLCVLIVVFLAVTSVANRWKEELQVERVDIRGCRILPEREVIALAKVPVGTPLYEVDLLAVRSRLRTNPYIKEAVVNHDLPSAIKITVQERRPAAILGGPEPFCITAEGYVLPSVTSKEVFDLPAITGLPQEQPVRAGDRINTEKFRVAIEILREAQALDPDLYHLISEINLASEDIIVYTAEQGVPILFGKDRIRTQLGSLQSFWNQHVRQEGAENLKAIDLRFEGQVVVRWNHPTSQEKSL